MNNNRYLVEDLTKDIHETFELTLEEAEGYAIGMFKLIAAHGSDPSRTDAFTHIIRLHGEKLRWRNAAKREEWQSRKKAAVAGYNAFLDSARSSPFKKW